MAVEAHDFESWYREAWPRLVAAITVFTRDVHVAEDVVAEALSRAYERWDDVGAMQSPVGWSYRVAANLGRRRARRVALEEMVLGRSRPDLVWVDPDLVDPAIWAAVAALPSRQRAAVALRYVLDLPQDEVATSMGVAPGTAAATLHAARARLASALGALGHGQPTPPVPEPTGA
jgi:DNA-directed RNA polymerase specialized sigma24 family protein